MIALIFACYGLYLTYILSFELLVGKTPWDYQSSGVLRQPNNLQIVFRSLQLLHTNMLFHGNLLVHTKLLVHDRDNLHKCRSPRSLEKTRCIDKRSPSAERPSINYILDISIGAGKAVDLKM